MRSDWNTEEFREVHEKMKQLNVKIERKLKVCVNENEKV